jgi:hypothetical protein
MIKSKIYITICSCLFATLLAAQPGGTKPPGNVADQSQDVVKNFDAKLLESEKVKVNPVLPAVDTTTKAQSYNVPNKVLVLEYQPPKMRPISMAQGKLPPQYNGFAKLGYGFPNSPYGEAAYRFGDPKVYMAGIKAKYHAADNSAKIENQRFSILDVEANGTYFLDIGMAIDGKIGFNQNTNHYYGYNFPSKVATFSEEASKQRFNDFGASLKLYNSVRTVADFNYGVGLNLNVYSDNFTSKETDFLIKAEATKWFAEKHPLTLVLKTDFTSYTEANASNGQSLNNIHLLPSFTFKSDYFSLKLGGNLISSADIFYPKPDIEANLSVAGNKLGIFAGWKGDFIKNNFRNLTKYNPFIFSKQTIKNTDVTEYYGGVKGAVSGFEYSAQTGWSSNKNLALFLLDSSDSKNRFNVVYDTVSIFNIRGAITFKPINDMELTATVSQNIYTAEKEKAAWGLPSLDMNIGAKYKIFNDAKANTTASVRANLFVQNGVNVKKFDGTSERLNALIDLSLGGEVFFTENIGVFLDVNNILDNKRQRWQNLPIFGLNILGGVTARF